MKVEKILESYSILPEPYRSQAIKNYDPSHYSKNRKTYIRNGFNNDLAFHLTIGFKWDETPEGDNYWCDFVTILDREGVYEKLRREYILKLL